MRESTHVQVAYDRMQLKEEELNKRNTLVRNSCQRPEGKSFGRYRSRKTLTSFPPAMKVGFMRTIMKQSSSRPSGRPYIHPDGKSEETISQCWSVFRHWRHYKKKILLRQTVNVTSWDRHMAHKRLGAQRTPLAAHRFALLIKSRRPSIPTLLICFCRLQLFLLPLDENKLKRRRSYG